MSITAIVENDTVKLPPGVHVPDGTKAEIILPGEEQAESPEKAAGRQWSPEELGAAAEQMVAEKDPVQAQAQWKRIAAGFTATRMPKVRRHGVPRAVLDHLGARVLEREIGAVQLTLLAHARPVYDFEIVQKGWMEVEQAIRRAVEARRRDAP